MGRRLRFRSVSRREFLELKGDVEIKAGEELQAWFDASTQTIYIYSGLESETYQRTLLHEHAHAIFAFSGLTELLEPELEEALCTALENLLELFQNKKFVEEMN